MSPGGADDLARELIDRQSLLDAVAAEQPAGSDAVAERIDRSVSTVNRVVTRFEDRGIVQRSSDGIRLTHTGELVQQATTELVDVVRIARDLHPILDDVGDTSFEIELGWFRSGTIRRATPADPYAPLTRYTELFFDSSSKSIVGDRFVVPRPGLEAALREIDDGVDCSCIWTRAAMERLVEQYPQLMEWSTDREHLEAYVAATVPFDFAIFDDRLLLYAFTERDGSMAVLADTTDADAVAWGRSVFAACRTESSPIALEQ